MIYRVYEDKAGTRRSWPLTPIPLVIAADEWEFLQASLAERAQLIETVTADIYGAGNLFRENRLPAAFVAGSPEFVRPLVGVSPPGGAHLRFYAADIARGPDGRWWVLRDRTQAPSGTGYALENRLALSHGIPGCLPRSACPPPGAVFSDVRRPRFIGAQPPGQFAGMPANARADERNLFRACLPRPLSRLSAGRGRRPTVRDDGVFIRTVSGLQARRRAAAPARRAT